MQSLKVTERHSDFISEEAGALREIEVTCPKTQSLLVHLVQGLQISQSGQVLVILNVMVVCQLSNSNCLSFTLRTKKTGENNDS